MKKELTPYEYSLADTAYNGSPKSPVVVTDSGVELDGKCDYPVGCPTIFIDPYKYDTLSEYCNAILTAQNQLDSRIADAIDDYLEDEDNYTEDDDYDN